MSHQPTDPQIPPVYPAPYATLAPAGRSKATSRFRVASLVLLLAVGGVSTLYLIERAAAAKTSSDQQAQILDLKNQLESTKDDLTDAKSDLRRAEEDLADAEAERTALAEGCPQAVQEFFDVAREMVLQGRTSSPEATSAAQRMVTACEISL